MKLTTTLDYSTILSPLDWTIFGLVFLVTLGSVLFGYYRKTKTIKADDEEKRQNADRARKGRIYADKKFGVFGISGALNHVPGTDQKIPGRQKLFSSVPGHTLSSTNFNGLTGGSFGANSRFSSASYLIFTIPHQPMYLTTKNGFSLALCERL